MTVRREVAVSAALSVAAIVGIGAAGFLAARTAATEEALRQAEQATELLAQAVIQPAIDDDLLEGDADAIADLDVRAWVDGPGQPIGRVPSDIRELVREMDRAANAPGRVKGRPIQLDPPASERLDRLTMPILAVVGGLDFSETLASGRYLEEHVPSARLLVMPDVAHMIALEAPAELAAEIVALVAPLEPWS